METGFYDKGFYDRQRYGSFLSAAVILPFILQRFPQISSMVDIGCGVGTWCSVAKLMGLSVLGKDGNSVFGESMLEANEYVQEDFGTTLADNGRKYDLCISLEVAEHLPPDKGEDFVRYLCGHADLVLFGAAIPTQGGANHINCRWQSYWASLFRKNGYVCFDVVRKPFWCNPNVKWWYAQNTLVFCKETRSNIMEFCKKAHAELPIDIAHPCLTQNYDKGSGTLIDQKIASFARLAHYHVMGKRMDDARKYMQTIADTIA